MHMDYAAKFSEGLAYDEFLARFGTDEHRRRWSEQRARIVLSANQQSLLAGFTRQMPVICLAGAWCGDCVQQCPIFDHFAHATDKLDIRYFDRDTHDDLSGELKICGGARVPTVLFLSEDFTDVGRYGDRTLSRYRHVAQKLDGASCPSGLGAPDLTLLAAVVQDWLDEFERAQLILRTSGRLRQKHGD